MPKIIVTGPESSGKSTLCKALSIHLKIPCTKEYAREFLDKLGRNYKKDDLLEIAKGQLDNEQTTANKHQLSLHDTDLITIKIWSEHKYSSCNKWILAQIEKQKSNNRFYLLCKPDIPWQADTQRENPHEREKLFKIYKKQLENLGHNYLIVEGKGSKRLRAAIKIVDEINKKMFPL